MIRELIFSAQESPAEAPAFFTAEQRVAANSYKLTRGEGVQLSGLGTSRKKLVAGKQIPVDPEDGAGAGAERRTQSSGGEAAKKGNILLEQQSSSVVEGRRIRSKK
jgi:hypothetical protein